MQWALSSTLLPAKNTQGVWERSKNCLIDKSVTMKEPTGHEGRSSYLRVQLTVVNQSFTSWTEPRGRTILRRARGLFSLTHIS